MRLNSFSQMFAKNDLGFKPNGFKRYLQPNEKIVEIEKKLASGLSVDDLSEDEYMTLNAFEKAESAAFHAEVNAEMSKAEQIAIKLAKGKTLTAEEERFISEKYPDLRREADEARKQGEELRKRIESAKTPEEKQEIAANALGNVGSMLSKGTIAPIQAEIKYAAIEQAIEESKNGDSKLDNLLPTKNRKSHNYFINTQA